MKNFKIISLLSLSLAISSCESLYEDKYIEQWGDETTWGVAAIAQGVVNDIYVGIPHRPDTYDSNFLDAATDNAATSYYGSSISDLGSGNYSMRVNPLSCWSTNYGYIQMACYYLENGMSDALTFNPSNEDSDIGERYRLIGEAYFLRAYFTFDLLKIYGGKGTSGKAMGVPIVTEFTDRETGEDILADGYVRPTYQETIDQVISDLDNAIAFLGDTRAISTQVVGRADLNTARAFKTRVLLYSASPAYQDDSVVTIHDSKGNFTVANGTTYTDKWASVAGTIGELYSEIGSFSKLNATDLANVTATSTPSDFVFRFYFNNRTMETAHFLPRYFGTAYTIPSQNLVDAFPMANGYPITDSRSEYDPENPYEGRDDRFYMNIYYHGAEYGSSTYATDEFPLTTVDILPGGADSRDGVLNGSANSYASKTGYYLAKFMSKNHTMNNPLSTSNVTHYWPELRRTEVALSYAEAANEAWGPEKAGTYYDEYGIEQTATTTAYDIIKAIRSTSGGVTDTSYLDEVAGKGKDAFRALIQNERRIELAFEDHRFFDMRRCLLDLTEPIYGVSATLGDDGETVEYETVYVEDRKYDGVKYYYLPLPYTEVVKGIESNLGWE
ncbi:MAG: RagB/SusD family nutrient uptake outer membrane protein [Rikenellaceae bacterium]